MNRITAFIIVFAILLSLCGCKDESKAEGDVLKDNGISSSIGVEVGN